MTDEEKDAGCYYDKQGNFQLPTYVEVILDKHFEAWIDELEETHDTNNTGNVLNRRSS